MQWHSRRSIIGLIDLLEFHCYEVLKKESCGTSSARFISLIHQKKDNQDRTKTFPEAKAKKGAWIPAPFLAFSTVNTETHHMLPLRPWFWKLWCLKLATRHLQMMRCKEPTQAAVRCCSWRQQVHLTKKKLRSLYCCAILTPASFLFLDEPNGAIAAKVSALGVHQEHPPFVHSPFLRKRTQGRRRGNLANFVAPVDDCLSQIDPKTQRGWSEFKCVWSW